MSFNEMVKNRRIGMLGGDVVKEDEFFTAVAGLPLSYQGNPLFYDFYAEYPAIPNMCRTYKAEGKSRFYFIDIYPVDRKIILIKCNPIGWDLKTLKEVEYNDISDIPNIINDITSGLE